MSREVMQALAVRHQLDAEELIEAWEERAAILEYLGGSRRPTAEVWAIGEVERMYQVGLHDPEARRRWAAGGQRVRPGRSAA